MMARVRRRYWPVPALAATAWLAACGSVRYPQHYVLNVTPPAAASAPAAGALGSLVVRELQCPAYLCDDRVVYREMPHRIGFYDYHRWAVHPRAALTRLLADRLRAASLFESVTVARNASRAAYLLRGEIDRFEEVDEQASVRVICTISVELIDVKTEMPVWRSTASEAIPLQQRNVPGVVEALSVASGIVADRLVTSLAGGFARPSGR